MSLFLKYKNFILPKKVCFESFFTYTHPEQIMKAVYSRTVGKEEL